MQPTNQKNIDFKQLLLLLASIWIHTRGPASPCLHIVWTHIVLSSLSCEVTEWTKAKAKQHFNTQTAKRGRVSGYSLPCKSVSVCAESALWVRQQIKTAVSLFSLDPHTATHMSLSLCGPKQDYQTHHVTSDYLVTVNQENTVITLLL